MCFFQRHQRPIKTLPLPPPRAQTEGKLVKALALRRKNKDLRATIMSRLHDS